jgi:hypothetical protein
MSDRDDNRPMLASAAECAQTVRLTSSLVPSKRKAPDEVLTTEIRDFSRSKEDSDDHGLFVFMDEESDDEYTRYSMYTDEDLDHAHIMVLEEEDAVRVQALLASNQNLASEMQRDFDRMEDLLRESEDEYHAQEYIDAAIAADWACQEENSNGLLAKDDLFFEENILSDFGQMSDPEFQNRLCSRCRSVRWYNLAFLRTRVPHMVYKLRGSPLKLRAASCNICRFLGKIGSGRVSLAGLQDGTLEFEMSLRHSFGGSAKVLCVSINGRPEQSLITLHSTTDQNNWSPRPIDPEDIDYNALKTMVAKCCNDHAGTCRPKPGLQLSGFRVIKCASRQVVLAPTNCKYAALSYVWGQSPQNPNAGLTKLRFPVTVEDSCRVAKRLGFEYLWVDRYV